MSVRKEKVDGRKKNTLVFCFSIVTCRSVSLLGKEKDDLCLPLF